MSDTRTLVLVRHGESTWNLENRFTGWTDVPLTDFGAAQARIAGRMLRDRKMSFDVVHVSVLTRALQTMHHALDEAGLLWVPVEKSWRLNERHYGDLQGRNKSETVAKYGEAQTKVWRRSFDVAPPPIAEDDPRHPRTDVRYAGVPASALPRTECLKDTIARFLPLWETRIAPDLRAGRRVLIVAHGNSLRALRKHIEGISEQAIVGLDVPTGQPFEYTLDADLKPVRGAYLDPAAADAAAAAVKAQIHRK